VTDKLVSVVVPTHYRNESLRETLESVRLQTYDPIEVFVVDDSGEGHARATIEGFDVEYVAHDENRGSNPARNTGIQASSGRYVQLLDDDDRILPRKIETQVALLESSPETGVVYGGVLNKAGDKVYPDDWCRADPLQCALRIIFPGTFPSSMLIERDVLTEVTPLRYRPAADDIGFTIELAQRTGFDHVDEVLTDIGRSETHQSASINFPLEVRKIIREYDHVYERYPPEVRHAALSFMYESLATHTLNERAWSPTATAAFVKAAYHGGSVSSPRPVLLVAAAASVFGRPGVEIASRVRGILA
jgi:glycosyltransferase involved in cell wall biosynthesis